MSNCGDPADCNRLCPNFLRLHLDGRMGVEEIQIAADKNFITHAQADYIICVGEGTEKEQQEALKQTR